MIHFFENQSKTVFAVQMQNNFQLKTFQIKLADSHKNRKSVITDFFVDPRSTMVTLPDTNARNYTKIWAFQDY
jgi:phosphoribosylformylglycinamidine synthase